MSYNLSGNKNNQALNEDDKGDKLHAMVYDASEFITNPEIKLTRGGMVLFALLAGGDYDNVRLCYFAFISQLTRHRIGCRQDWQSRCSRSGEVRFR